MFLKNESSKLIKLSEKREENSIALRKNEPLLNGVNDRSNNNKRGEAVNKRTNDKLKKDALSKEKVKFLFLFICYLLCI